MAATRLLRVGQVTLAFGLDWVPVLDDPEAASAQARREGAGHQVLSGNPPAALGLARGLPPRDACWSAADLLARQHPQGSVACVLPLDPHTWHVLACHEGVVLARADRSYPDADLAARAVDALRLACPRLRLLPADDGAEALLQGLARQAAGVPPMRHVRGRVRPLAVSAVLVSVAAAAWGWGGLAGSARVDAAPDPRAAWEAALARTLARQPIHGEAGTRSLLQALQAQPVRAAGWVLQGLRCQPGDGAWQCHSEYRRLDPRADNRGLLQAAPADWRLEFPSLDTARAAWRLPLPGRAAEPARLPSSALVARDWASALQAVSPAFTALRMDPPRALAVPAPHDAQGRPLPEPPDLPSVATRALRVEGPLRSAELLAPLVRSVSWRKAHLSHASGTRPSLRHSRLILHLEGSLYESLP